MTVFPMISRYFRLPPRVRAQSLLAIAALAALGASGAAARQAGAYDGTWTTVFATSRGNCSSGYSVPFLVSGQPGFLGRRRPGLRLGRPRRQRRGGGLGRRLACIGGGRLAGNSGYGRWSGIITGDRCSGTWQASRS